MRILQRITIVLFALVSIAFIGTRVYVATSVDRVSPVITCDSALIEVEVGASDEELLAGVSAADDRDGDLSSQIMIKGISQLISADTARVTYVVFDSSNNMATAQRDVRYTNYERPRFKLTQPLIFQTGSQIKLLGSLSAEDVIDGDISGSIRVTKQNVNSSTPGVYSITFQVTNSMGDTESIPAKVVVRDDVPAKAPLILSGYVVYVEQGADFDPTDYVLVPAYTAEIEIKSQVDTSAAGAYEVEFSYQDYTVYMTVIVR